MKEVIIEPPANLLLPTPATMYNGTNFSDIITYVEQLRSDLDSCNQDKQSITDFITEIKKEKPSQ